MCMAVPEVGVQEQGKQGAGWGKEPATGAQHLRGAASTRPSLESLLGILGAGRGQPDQNPLAPVRNAESRSPLQTESKPAF